MLAFRISERQRLESVELDEPELPEGATEVLSVVGRAYVIVDVLDGVVRASPAAYAFGLVRGHTVVHPQLLELTSRVRRDGVIEERRLELPRGPLGHGTIIIQVRVAQLGDEYILLLADDRTEITRTEEIRNDFVANVSHELKTPVGAISLLSEAIDGAAEDEEAVRRFARRMHRESNRLSALVQDIIELSRLQGTNVVHEGRPVDLNSVIAEAVDRNKLPAESKNIEIVVGGHVDASVYGDRDLLMTAFRNLIDNAIRYSPEGSRVGVGLRAADGLALVSVTDQGPRDPGRGTGTDLRAFLPHRCCPFPSDRRNRAGFEYRQTCDFQPRRRSIRLVPSRGGSTFTVRLPEMETDDEPEAGSSRPAGNIKLGIGVRR